MMKNAAGLIAVSGPNVHNAKDVLHSYTDSRHRFERPVHVWDSEFVLINRNVLVWKSIAVYISVAKRGSGK